MVKTSLVKRKNVRRHYLENPRTRTPTLYVLFAGIGIPYSQFTPVARHDGTRSLSRVVLDGVNGLLIAKNNQKGRRSAEATCHFVAVRLDIAGFINSP